MSFISPAFEPLVSSDGCMGREELASCFVFKTWFGPQYSFYMYSFEPNNTSHLLYLYFVLLVAAWSKLWWQWLTFVTTLSGRKTKVGVVYEKLSAKSSLLHCWFSVLEEFSRVLKSCVKPGLPHVLDRGRSWCYVTRCKVVPYLSS